MGIIKTNSDSNNASNNGGLHETGINNESVFMDNLDRGNENATRPNISSISQSATGEYEQDNQALFRLCKLYGASIIGWYICAYQHDVVSGLTHPRPGAPRHRDFLYEETTPKSWWVDIFSEKGFKLFEMLLQASLHPLSGKFGYNNSEHSTALLSSLIQGQ